MISSRVNLNLTGLSITPEEADTRMILHCLYTQSSNIVVWSRDTDVLFLLIAHTPAMQNKQVWMKAGTSSAPKFIQINAIVTSWNMSEEVTSSLLAFHAITASDTRSYLSGHTKMTTFRRYLDSPELLLHLGRDTLTEETIQRCELFICNVYNAAQATSADEAWVILFKKGVDPEKLPPTSDALKLHIMRNICKP